MTEGNYLLLDEEPAAREWVLRSDQANARLIEAGRDRADLVVTA